ncbi:hypothetical protein AB6A40_009128 [Gnathostoma spinigerum]|uniref:Hcy-binding domain-containing protein n=1 Tax=Gnathostoma spinigerum TaxID=75299 RepID=A0ABD6EW51_9BILA
MSTVDFSKLQALDGGFGFELDARNALPKGDPLWSAAALLDNPDVVVDIHKRYIKAGCDIIRTNSYQANVRHLVRTRNMTESAASEVVKKSVRLARKAIDECRVGRSVVIVGSVGSFATEFADGSEYHGRYADEYNEEEMSAYFVAQAKPLVEEGVKVLAFETIPAKNEAFAVLKALDLLPDDISCWISLSCRDGLYTCHGDLYSEVVDRCTKHPKVVAMSINCTPPEFISILLDSAKNVTNGKPFIVYPNSGETFDAVTGKFLEQTKRENIADMIPKWVELGAKVIGGCCRVMIDDIEKIARIVHKLSN